MKIQFNQDLFEKCVAFIFVIPIYVGLIDAFLYTVTGRTLTNMEWTWQRVTLVFLFFIIRVSLTISFNKAKAKKEQEMKNVN